MVAHRLLAVTTALALGGCLFDGGGVNDDVAPDSAPDIDGLADGDGDGTPDDFDNCPDTSNADQADEDGDEIGDVCDNCPHVANDDQANDGEDGAGDACDPDPDRAGNDIIFFSGFADETALDDWGTFNGGNWTIEDGALRQSSTTGVHTLYHVDQQMSGGIVDTRVTIDVRPTTASESAFGTLLSFTPGAGSGSGYYCVLHDHPNQPSATGTTAVWVLQGASPPVIESAAVMNDNIEEGATYVIRQVREPDGLVSCAAASDALPQRFEVEGSDTTYAGGLVGLRTIRLGITVDYIVVFGSSTDS
jgi:hypothetical protein